MPCNRRYDVVGFELPQKTTLVAMITQKGVVMKVRNMVRGGVVVALCSTGIGLLGVATTTMSLTSATNCVGSTCTSVDGSGFSVTGSRTWFQQPCGPYIQAHEWDDNGTFNEYSPSSYVGQACLTSSPGFDFGGFNAETDTTFHGDFYNGDFWVGSETTAIGIYGTYPKVVLGQTQDSNSATAS
jgi:hypothetical protein